MALLVVGSIALDTIRTPDGKEYADVLGGSCTYFSCAASYLTDVQLVGVVGEDFAQEHVDLLKGRNIDLQGLEIRKGGETFRWAGTYAANMNERTTDALQFGVLADFDPVLPASHKETPYVFLACAAPQLQLKVMDQMTGNPFVVCDTIEFYIETEREALGEVFKRCNGVIINDSEVLQLTGDTNVVRAADKILAMGPEFAVLKKGEHGGILATKDGLFPFPAYPLKDVADPTGAGDSFAGGFMGHLARVGRTDVDALRQATVYGTVQASFTCSGISLSRIAELTDPEIEARVAEFKAMLQTPE